MVGERISTVTKEVNGEWKIPGEVHISNWHDDVPEEFEAESKSFDFEPFNDEVGYKSPDQISEEAKDKLDHYAKNLEKYPM